MTQTQPQPFKKKYKLEGMVASVIVMWLDYGFIYNGLVNSDVTQMSIGMVIMLIGAGIAYYFG